MFHLLTVAYFLKNKQITYNQPSIVVLFLWIEVKTKMVHYYVDFLSLFLKQYSVITSYIARTLHWML